MKKSNKNSREQLAQTSAAPKSILRMLEMLVDTVRDYGVILLDPDGKVLSWNGGAERLKGWTADEIIGQHFSKFYPPEDVQRGKTEQELKEAAEHGRFEDEGWRLRKDGSRFWANVVITALRDENGKLLGFGKLTRDLSERRQAEERLKQQTKETLEMATVPVVQVWDGILLVPIIGTLNSDRTQQLMEQLLHRVAATNSEVALLDITGVPTIDTQIAQHLIETISAVRLLGAEVILTGVRPIIAQTLVHLGIDLSNVMTRSSLAAGLQVAFGLLNLGVSQNASNATRAAT